MKLLIVILTFFSLTPIAFANSPVNITPELTLDLRVHLMNDVIMDHENGIHMDQWVTPDDVRNTILPELNSIYKQGDRTNRSKSHFRCYSSLNRLDLVCFEVSEHIKM